MKKFVLLGLLIVGPTSAAWAQEILPLNEAPKDQIEFLQSLRRKGYGSIANEYVDLLLKRSDAEFTKILQLERARNSVALAKEGKSPDEKAKLLSEARRYFEPFVKGSPKSVVGAQARFELAKLLSLQALGTLNKALAAEEAADKEKGARAARDIYDAADAEFVAGIKVLEELSKSSKNTENDIVQAKFDQANNKMEKAQAYVSTASNESQNRERATTINEAQKIFIPIARDKENPNGLMANAYLVKCYEEGQDPQKRTEHFLVVINALGKAAEPAQRLVRYYDILFLASNPSVPKAIAADRAGAMIEECGKWMKDYPTARKSYLGEAIRFELAVANMQKANQITDGFKKDKYDKTKANKKEFATLKKYFDEPLKICNELILENGDFAERATGLKEFVDLKVFELEGLLKEDYASRFLMVKIAFNKVRNAKNDEERKTFVQEGLHQMAIAVKLGKEEGISPSKLHELQFIHGSILVGTNDLHRAAIAFEALARDVPPSKKGAEAAEYAVELYRIHADKDKDESARARLHDIAAFALEQKLWKDNLALIGTVRFNLASDFQAQEKYLEALENLKKLPKEYPAYTYAMSQGVFVALMGREKERADDAAADLKPWNDAARAMLARVGPLPASADANTTLRWFLASMEGPKFDYADAKGTSNLDEGSVKCHAMAKKVEELKAEYAKSGGKVSKEKKEQIGFTLDVLDKYVRLGMADIEYRKRNYQAVLDPPLLGKTIADLLAHPDLKGDKIKVKDVRVMGESVSLALRAFVQKGSLPAAKKMYEIMLKIQPEEGVADTQGLTRDLIKDLSLQVETLKQNKEEKTLKEMVGNFASFVDQLADQLVTKNKNPDARDIKNLAKFYGSLGLYKKAADLFKSIPPPKNLDQKGGKFTKAEEAALAQYWNLQIDFGKLLLQSKEFKEANKVFSRIITHPNGKLQTIAEHEQIHIYEEMEPPQFGTAIKLWKGHMEALQRADLKNVEVKKLYFDSYYYNVVCWYRYSQSDKAKKDKKTDDYLNYAANQILRLEASQGRDGWDLVGPRFGELLAKEPGLKLRYEQLKKK